MGESRSRALWLVLLLAAAACGAGCGEADDVFGDLTGTIYILQQQQTGGQRVLALTPASGDMLPVEGAPVDNASIAADIAGTFLVVGYGDLLRLDLASRELRVIVADRFTTTGPAVSPSAARVAYRRSLPEGPVLAQRGVDGTNEVVVQVALQNTSYYQPEWLDEQSILFLRDDSTGVLRIWVVGSDGGEAAPLGGDTGIIQDLAVAPTTRRLALLTLTDDRTTSEIWDVSSATAARVRRVASFAATGPGFTWSPDEQYMAFCLPSEAGDYDIAVVHRETGQIKRFPGPGDECDPVWTER